MTDMQPRKPRIALVKNPNEEQSRLLARTVITEGDDPLNLFLLLARHSELMKRVNALGGIFMAHSSIDPREREFIILRVAHQSDCTYETSQHLPIAERAGMSAAEIEAARLSAEDPRMPEDFADLALLTDAVLSLEDVEDRLWERLRQRYSDEHLLEFCVLPGFYRMLAGLLISTRVPVETEEL